MEIARNLMRIPKNCGNLFKKLLLVGPCVCWSEWPGGKQTAYIHLPVHFPIHNLAVAFGTREMRCNSNPAPCPPFFTPPPPSALLTTHFLPYSPPLSGIATHHPLPPSGPLAAKKWWSIITCFLYFSEGITVRYLGLNLELDQKSSLAVSLY